MEDYAVDRRGDVGSWVREESMLGLRTVYGLIMESSEAKRTQISEGKVIS
jgi:hypothetical protein